MDAAMINPFVEGTLYILDTTASVKASPQEPFLKRDDKAMGDISGILEISGALTGSASVTFTEESILGIVSAMFGEEMSRIDDEIIDAVGEIGNMISGHVTTKMTEMGRTVKVKLSKVETGSAHPLVHASGSRVIALPFKTTKGRIVIEVAY